MNLNGKARKDVSLLNREKEGTIYDFVLRDLNSRVIPIVISFGSKQKISKTCEASVEEMLCARIAHSAFFYTSVKC